MFRSSHDAGPTIASNMPLYENDSEVALFDPNTPPKDRDPIKVDDIPGMSEDTIFRIYDVHRHKCISVWWFKRMETVSSNRICDYCSYISPDKPWGKCSACLEYRYCSKECQKVDWKEHKIACKVGVHISRDAQCDCVVFHSGSDLLFIRHVDVGPFYEIYLEDL